DPGANVGQAAPVHVQLDVDVRLGRLAVDDRAAAQAVGHSSASISFTAVISRSVSSGVPAEMRTYASNRGWSNVRTKMPRRRNPSRTVVASERSSRQRMKFASEGTGAIHPV